MPRLRIDQHAPEGYQAVAALDGYLHRSMDPVLLELIKLRASQLNGCAYCVDLHATSLERQGVPTRRIYAVSAWRETGYFSTVERAALDLTEQVTRLSDGVSEQVWQEAAAAFTERELSDLLLAIGTINLWNRLGVSTHLSPPPLAD